MKRKNMSNGIERKRRIEIANLEIDAKIGKDRHFIAAHRKNILRLILGTVAVIGSAFIASGILEYSIEIFATSAWAKDLNPEWTRVLNRVVPLTVGICTAMLSFLGLEKDITQHRSLGNKYIQIARETRKLLNSSFDDITIEKEYDSLLKAYLEINAEGEGCPTSEGDARKAVKKNEVKRNNIKEKASKSDDELFDDSNKRN